MEQSEKSEVVRVVEDAAAVAAYTARRWWLVQTGGHSERLSRFHLQRQGFEAYLPLRAVTKKAVGSDAAVTALFPRYLFVAVPDVPRWHDVRATIGVVGLVRSAGADHPLEVSGRMVAAIKAREVLGLVSLDEERATPRTQHGFSKGDRLRVTAGVLTGYDVLFERQSDADRVLVLLRTATGDMRLHVAAGDLKTAG